MAEKIQIEGAGTAKVRNPVAVPILSLITIGVYHVYWWYQINREMRDLGQSRNVQGLGENPTLSLLAVFPGFLILVPPYVTLYSTVKRAQRAEEVTVGSVTLNGWIVLALLVSAFVVGLTALVIPWYIQNELNKVWEVQPSLAEGVGAELPASQAAPEVPQTSPPPPPPSTSSE